MEFSRAAVPDVRSPTLRSAMAAREGEREATRQIQAGRRAWAVERRGALQPRGRSRAVVFGTCLSDAVRRASAPGRLGEEHHDDVTDARPITSGWDQPVSWPFEARRV